MHTTDFRASGKRYRRTFPTKAEAQRFEHYIKAQAATGQDWNPKANDSRRLSEIVNIWNNLYGQSVDRKRYSELTLLTDHLNNPIAAALKPEDWLTYQSQRLANGVSAKTLNNKLGYLRTVYNKLIKADVIDYANPLQNIEPIRLQERKLTYLTLPQVSELREAIQQRQSNDGGRLAAIVDLCLSTGARWGEAEDLTREQVHNDRVTFENTKGKKVRTVQIEPALAKKIKKLVPLAPHGCKRNAFRRTAAKCSFDLPPGQNSHVLRHTFAAHFIIGGGNIVALQNILGHSTINMTMRYAHLAPDYSIEALKLNPIGQLLDKENEANA